MNVRKMLTGMGVTIALVIPLALPGESGAQATPRSIPAAQGGGVFVADEQAPGSADAAKYTWGWVTGTVYYNRLETRKLKTVSFLVLAAAGICAFFGSYTLGAACVIAGAVLAQWQYVAGNAYGNGGCVKIRVPYFWAYRYTGGYCK